MKYQFHLAQIFKKHGIAFLMATILAIGLMVIGVLEDKLIKTVTYLIVMVLCFLLSEFIYFTGNPSIAPWKINSQRKELWVVMIVSLIGFFTLTFWFLVVDQAHTSRLIRIAAMVMRLLFIFPVVMLVYFLGFRKYNLREIGLWNFKYWFVSIPLIILIGGVSYLLFPEDLQFEMAYKTRGIQGFIVLGFLTAAIPEEIARTLFQSRLGAVLSLKSAAWFIVSFIWALQHIPLFSYQANGDIYEAVKASFGILPMGLLWGYLNERYKSIIPSVLIHGTNLWGIQNIF